MSSPDFNEGRRYALQTLEGLENMPPQTIEQAVKNLTTVAHSRLDQWMNPNFQLGVLSIVELIK